MIEIDRCYCFGVSFAELRAHAQSTGASTIEELQKKVVFGKQCELCHAYVRRTLETGQVVFNEIIEPDQGAISPDR